ncbi:MBL fold metallo-hydrolase RNA specificity domain-containing protein [Staphylococcus aureus]
MMINIMKPEYFIPVQGEFKMQIAHAELLRTEEQVLLSGKDFYL